MIVDKSTEQKVVRYLEQLGLSHEQAMVYLLLVRRGPHTVLAISRELKTGRTKLYPLLEELANKQLIAIHERHYGTSYEAHPPEVLDFLVSEHERRTDNMRKNLPAAQYMLKNELLESPTTSKVVEYRGVDGLKQINWNMGHAGKEFRVFELAGLDTHLGKHFADKMRGIWSEKHISSFDLTNNPSRALDTGIDMPDAQARYINPTIFKIEFETYIYNNCVALLSYQADDIFGVEIHNPQLARQQKQIFDLIWSQAKPLTVPG